MRPMIAKQLGCKTRAERSSFLINLVHLGLISCQFLPGPNVINIFVSTIYNRSWWAKVFVPSRPFQPSLMFVGNVRSLPPGGASEKCSQVSSNLHKHYSRLESLPGTNTSLLRKFFNYGCKMFYKIGWVYLSLWVPDIFCNFYLMENHNIGNDSATTEAREEIKRIFRAIKILEIFSCMFD